MTAKRGCATCYISLYIVAGGVYASGEADLFVRVYLDPVAYSGVFSPFFFLEYLVFCENKIVFGQ